MVYIAVPGGGFFCQVFDAANPGDLPDIEHPETRKVLYRLPELLKLDQQYSVFIVEGEKDCNRLVSMNLVATWCAKVEIVVQRIAEGSQDCHPARQR